MDIERLVRWSETNTPNSSLLKVPGLETNYDSAPFSHRHDLNNKIILWEGDIASLRVNAIVHPSNESFTENSGISHRVLEAAGPRLKDELVIWLWLIRRNNSKISGAVRRQHRERGLRAGL